MNTSLFIARLLGPIWVIVGIGMLLNQKTFQRVCEDFCKNQALVFFSGMAPLFFGFIIVLTHNIWVSDWPVLITIFGWMGIIKGIWITVFPNSVEKFMLGYTKNPKLLTFHSVACIVLGGVMIYLGYMSNSI